MALGTVPREREGEGEREKFPDCSRDLELAL